MASVDPALGSHNAWRGDLVESGPTPTLYHSEGNYHSQVVRLALVEKGATYRSRLLDLTSLLEQARASPCTRRRRVALLRWHCERARGETNRVGPPTHQALRVLQRAAIQLGAARRRRAHGASAGEACCVTGKVARCFQRTRCGAPHRATLASVRR